MLHRHKWAYPRPPFKAMLCLGLQGSRQIYTCENYTVTYTPEAEFKGVPDAVSVHGKKRYGLSRIRCSWAQPAFRVCSGCGKRSQGIFETVEGQIRFKHYD